MTSWYRYALTNAVGAGVRVGACVAIDADSPFVGGLGHTNPLRVAHSLVAIIVEAVARIALPDADSGQTRADAARDAVVADRAVLQ